MTRLTHNNVYNYFTVLNKIIGYAAEAQKIVDKRTGDAFNIFDTYINTNEVMLSKIIADLIDPAAAHAHGNVFLKLFLKEIGIHQILDHQAIKVTTEEQTRLIQSNRRFIDIFVHAPNFSVAIENKPSAYDQDNQITDYMAYARATHANAYIVYLSGDGSSPSVNSISKETWDNYVDKNTAFTLSYNNIAGEKSLVRWLRQCAVSAQSDKLRHFLKDFEKHIQQNYFITDKQRSSKT